MVRVKLYNLIRSKYGIDEIPVPAGSIHEIIEEILRMHPIMNRNDFSSAIVFYRGKPIHFHGFHTVIEDNEEIIITHFVGGG